MRDESSPDALLDGRLRLRQAPRGHRAGTDAILLAAAVPAGAAGLLVDAGCGSGAAGLAAALAHPGLDLVLVDREPEALELAKANLALNGLNVRGRVAEADLLVARSRRAAALEDGAAAIVISNPPFLDPGQGRASPDARRARAHVFDAPDGLDRWIRACVAMTAPQGEAVLIQRADRLDDCLKAMEGRLGGIAVLPIYPRQGEDAVRVLIRGRKGSRAPMRLRPGLILHEADGRFTPQAEAIHRGRASIEW